MTSEVPGLLTFDGTALLADGRPWSPRRDLWVVLGHPVAHSRSPEFHNAAMAAVGIDADYTRLDAAPDAMPALLEAAHGLGIRGGSITIPLKEIAATLCGELTDEARTLGAVNAFAAGPDGWRGHNTDFGGLVEVLTSAGVGRGWRGVVLGAGGAARAAVAALERVGAEELTVAARSGPGRERTAAWRAGGGAPVFELAPWEPLVADERPAAVISTVPAGVPVRSVLPPVSTVGGDLLVDLRYGVQELDRPPEPWRFQDGEGLLIAQGALAFSWWFGIEPDRAVMRAALGG